MVKFRHDILTSIATPQGRCLGAVEVPAHNARRVYAYFSVGTDERVIQSSESAEVDHLRSVGDGIIARLAPTVDSREFTVIVGDEPLNIRPERAQTSRFRGLNTALAVRNGQTVNQTLDWLRYHIDTHGLNGAVIVDRSDPAGDNGYVMGLKRACKSLNGLQSLQVVQADMPLGAADLPDEAHPFNAPDAPGKDRMKVPGPDPWRAPLGELYLFEYLRRRFLGEARGVALLDISDLVDETPGTTVFDLAETSSTGAVVLEGRQCYPWRVRKGEDPAFGDHICRQFDAKKTRKRWCIAPDRLSKSVVWRLVRVVGTSPAEDEVVGFHRYMGLRHPTESVARIVPKTSLVEDARLVEMAETHWEYSPVRMPELSQPERSSGRRAAIITCMKNEGPFILEWLAYHRVIGVQDFLVYTNDCTDGTDTFLDLLQDKGYVQHRDNPFRESGMKPQHAALHAGESEDLIRNADWVASMDVDEYINVKTGDGTLDALFDAVPEANMIAMTWRLFGNNDVHDFVDAPIIGQFTRCAHEMTRKPHQAWGFKTLFRNLGLFKKLGVHRPKGLNPQLWQEIRWVNGSGHALPKDMYRNAWRSTTSTVGYDLVSLNHYAVRSAESFLVKRDRGRVNHVDRDQGLAYWFRMNNNAVEETSITRMLPRLREEIDRLLSDPEIAAAHEACVAAHRQKIDELKATPNYTQFFKDLTGTRMQRLSRMHSHFGANVFLAGPDVVPDNVALVEHPEDFFFTVERQETAH